MTAFLPVAHAASATAADAALLVPALVAAGVLARVAAIVAASAVLLPELSFRIRLTLALVLAAAACPAALEAHRLQSATAGTSAQAGLLPVLPLVAGELLVGMAMGAAASAVASAGAWAGGVLGSVAGLSWADDFDPDGDAQSAGMARLAWWISFGGFLTAGGLHGIVAGIVDSVRVMPVGTLLSAQGGAAPALVDLAAQIPALALSLAVTIAVPALVAVVAFHLTTAICLRTVPFASGPGFLQALAAVVLLATIYAGADAWCRGFGSLVQGPLERCFDLR